MAKNPFYKPRKAGPLELREWSEVVKQDEQTRQEDAEKAKILNDPYSLENLCLLLTEVKAEPFTMARCIREWYKQNEINNNG